MRCLYLACVLMFVFPCQAAWACGGYGAWPFPAMYAGSSASGAVVTAGRQMHGNHNKTSLLQLRRLDDATTATIFCGLADGSELDVLEADESTATDAQVTHLKLDLLTSDKVDEMLDQAVKLPQLTSITVNFCWGGAGALTKGQVEKLAQCQRLETIHLVKTTIAAGSLAPLNSSEKLTKLLLDQKCRVPVEELQGIESLRLIVSDKEFSPEQRKAMEANLPNCKWQDPSKQPQGG